MLKMLLWYPMRLRRLMLPLGLMRWPRLEIYLLPGLGRQRSHVPIRMRLMQIRVRMLRPARDLGVERRRARPRSAIRSDARCHNLLGLRGDSASSIILPVWCGNGLWQRWLDAWGRTRLRRDRMRVRLCGRVGQHLVARACKRLRIYIDLCIIINGLTDGIDRSGGSSSTAAPAATVPSATAPAAAATATIVAARKFYMSRRCRWVTL